MVQFVYEPEVSKAATYLTERLTKELQAGKRVLWLLSGGSNIALSVQIIGDLPSELLSQLSCLLTDERYGIPGHADSNWHQLSNAGFMKPEVSFKSVLIAGLTRDATCQRYAEVIDQAFNEADVVIAQLGIGGDGHIAGILPRSPAVNDNQSVVGYDSAPFQRITLTPMVLRSCQVAYAFVYGDTKLPALQRLHNETLSLEEQPSQVLKDIAEAYVYTDQPINEAGETS